MIGNKNKFAADLLMGLSRESVFMRFLLMLFFGLCRVRVFFSFYTKHTPLTAQQTPVNINSIQL